MRKLITRVLLVFVAFNTGLILITLLLSLQASSEYPMQGTLVKAGEHELHVIDSGSAQRADDFTIVLIHGASTSALDFSTNLHPALATQWRVLSLDRPGHGYSDRGDESLATDPAQQANVILDALHTLDIKKPVLIGHSWAGSVVMAALLANHEHINVAAGVLIAGAIYPWEGGSAWHVELSARPVLGDLFVWQYVAPLGRLSLDDAVKEVFAPEQVPPHYVSDTGLSLSLRPATYKHNSLDRTELSGYLALQAPNYPSITQPLLSIAAEFDHVVPAWNHHNRLINKLDHVQAFLIEGAGHAPHHTRTGLVASTIESFIRSLPEHDVSRPVE
ncbi:MAG: alpha/beta fold hydrolase [Granulosicoccus sp.]